MVKIGDWLQRTNAPLFGNEPFDWYPWSIAQVVQFDKDGASVLFACKCMTHDKSSTKFWYHGEYELLDIKTMQHKLEQHKVHCPYKELTHEIKAWTKTLQEVSSDQCSTPESVY